VIRKRIILHSYGLIMGIQ